MQILDLTPEHEALYFSCLEDWNEEVQEAGAHKACWYQRMKERGLRVKLALNDAGTVGGMIQYLPIEESTVEGRGLGRALLEAAERDAADLGATGMAAWGLILPFWMKGDRVEFRAVDTSDRGTLEEWGQSDALFVDGKQMWTGPPVPCDRIRKVIARRVRALG